MATLRFYPLNRILIGSLILFSLTACKLGSESDTSAEITLSINKEGGTVESPAGPLVVIPENALDRKEKIGIKTYVSYRELPVEMQAPMLEGFSFAEFTPHGLQFNTPVTITIPLEESQQPGLQFPLFYWNEGESVWEQTNYVATVDPSGDSFSADVDHFSTFGGGESGIFNGFNMGDEQACNWVSVNSQVNLWAWNFNRTYGGSGTKIPEVGCCLEVSGVKFEVTHECNGSAVPGLRVDGNTTTYDRSETAEHTATTEAGTTHFRITRYWRNAHPQILMFQDLNYTNITCSEDPKIEVRAYADCDLAGVPNARVEWEVEGTGEVNPTSGTTNAIGQATTSFSSEEEGNAFVKVTMYTCEGTNRPLTTRSSSDDICIAECDQMYLNLQMSFTHSGADVPWEFTDQISAYINYTVEKDTGQIQSGTSEAGHYSSIKMLRDNCSATEVSTPSFAMKIINGRATEDNIHVELVPQSMPLSFNMQCEYEHFDEPVDAPVPAYSNIFASIMGKVLKLDIPNRCGDTVEGKGSESFGADPPVQYNYSVSVQCEDSCER